MGCSSGRGMSTGSWFGGVENVASPVGNADFLAGLRRLAAAVRRRLAANGFQALDARRLGQQAAARDRLGGEQQPGNGVGIWTVVARLELANDLAAVIGFPGRPAIMLDHF